MRRDESKRCGAQCARIGRGHIRNAQSALSAKYQVDSFAIHGRKRGEAAKKAHGQCRIKGLIRGRGACKGAPAMVQAHRLMKKVGQGNALLKISFMKVEALWRHSAPSAPPRPTAKNESTLIAQHLLPSYGRDALRARATRGARRVPQ